MNKLKAHNITFITEHFPVLDICLLKDRKIQIIVLSFLAYFRALETKHICFNSMFYA